jgi:hypothetical protein
MAMQAELEQMQSANAGSGSAKSRRTKVTDTPTDALRDVQSKRDDVERAVEHVLRDWIAREHRRTWPDQAARDACFEAFSEFAAWCKENDLGDYILPSTGYVVALHLIEMRKQGATYKQVALTARAIAFYHDLHERWLDRLPISAALAFAKEQTKTR